MKVELIGLSQGISFENKQATNYLDFRKDTGELFRLSVPQTVAEALLAIMVKEEPAKPLPPPAPRPPLVLDEEEFLREEKGVTDGATEFGGDEDTSAGAEPLDEDSVPSL